MKIIIAGGTGRLGRALRRGLSARGHACLVLARSGGELQWDGQRLGDWAAAVDGADAVINLAGRSVDCRYTAENRQAIYASRLDSTRLLGEAIAAASAPPAVWLNSSTATIYRHALDRPQDEATGEIWRGDEPGVPDKWHFSADVARRWEAELAASATPCTRKVALRTAIVLEPEADGAFGILSRLARSGLGGRHGSGEQYVSWLHVEDFVRAVDFLLTAPLHGPVNLSAPGPLPNHAFCRGLREAWGRRWGVPSPGWLLEIAAVLMRTETELLLKSRWVVPTRLEAAGFRFQYPEYRAAIDDLVTRARMLASGHAEPAPAADAPTDSHRHHA